LRKRENEKKADKLVKALSYTGGHERFRMRKHHFTSKDASRVVVVPNEKKEKKKVQAKKIMHKLLFPNGDSRRLEMIKAQEEEVARTRAAVQADLKKRQKLKAAVHAELKKRQKLKAAVHAELKKRQKLKAAEKKTKIKQAQKAAEQKEMQAVIAEQKAAEKKEMLAAMHENSQTPTLSKEPAASPKPTTAAIASPKTAAAPVSKKKAPLSVKTKTAPLSLLRKAAVITSATVNAMIKATPSVVPKSTKVVAKKAMPPLPEKKATASKKVMLKKVLKKMATVVAKKPVVKSKPVVKPVKATPATQKLASKTFKDHSHYGESMRRFLKDEAKATQRVSHGKKVTSWRHVIDHEVTTQNVKPLVEHVAPAAAAALAGASTTARTASLPPRLANKLKHDTAKQKKLGHQLKLVKKLMKRMEHNKKAKLSKKLQRKLSKIDPKHTPHAQERSAKHASEMVHTPHHGYDHLVDRILGSHSRHKYSAKPAKQMAQSILHNMQGFAEADKEDAAKEKEKAHQSNISRLWNAGKLQPSDEEDEEEE